MFGYKRKPGMDANNEQDANKTPKTDAGSESPANQNTDASSNTVSANSGSGSSHTTPQVPPPVTKKTKRPSRAAEFTKHPGARAIAPAGTPNGPLNSFRRPEDVALIREHGFTPTTRPVAAAATTAPWCLKAPAAGTIAQRRAQRRQEEAATTNNAGPEHNAPKP
jgi:hypothetical protein